MVFFLVMELNAKCGEGKLIWFILKYGTVLYIAGTRLEVFSF